MTKIIMNGRKRILGHINDIFMQIVGLSTTILCSTFFSWPLSFIMATNHLYVCFFLIMRELWVHVGAMMSLMHLRFSVHILQLDLLRILMINICQVNWWWIEFQILDDLCQNHHYPPLFWRKKCQRRCDEKKIIVDIC